MSKILLFNTSSLYQKVPEKIRHYLEESIWKSSLNLRKKILNAKIFDHSGSHPLKYLKFGLDNGPVLIYLHGFAGEKHNFFLTGKFLSKKFQIIVPDIPGFGESSQYLDRTYVIENYAHWIDDLVQSLGLSKFHLIGDSLGGGIALRYTLDHPEKVLSLVLVDSAGVHPEKSRSIYCEFLEGKNLFLLDQPKDFDQFLNRVFHKRPYIPSPIFSFLSREFFHNRLWYEKLTRDLIQGPYGFSAEVPTWEQRIDLALNPLLRNIEIPTLVVWGEEDSLFPSEIAHIINREIKNSKLVIYPGVGHSPQAEIPWAFVQDLLKFYHQILG